MKAISLWQPWASALFAPLIKDGARCLKGFETRHWPMPARFVGESIAIHAAKRETQDERDFWLQVVMAEERRKEHARAFGEIGIRKYWDLPRGAIIGEVKFGASIRSEDMDAEVIEREEWWGNYSPGRFAWPVLEFRHYLTPVPFVGKQGFFEFEVPMGKEPDHG